MKYELVEFCNKNTWDAFVASSPQGSVFCATPFLDAYGQSYRPVMVTAEGVPLLGALLLLDDGEPSIAPSPLTIYQGVMFARAICELPIHRQVSQVLALSNFLLARLEEQYARVSFCLHYRFPDLRSFSWFHYHERDKGMFRIDLRYTGLVHLSKTYEWSQFLKGIRDVRRHECRKAESAGWVVEQSNDIALLERLHQLTFQRQGLREEEEIVSSMKSVATVALSQGFGKMLVCRSRSGVVASATFFLFDANCGYYWVGANDPDQRKSGASTYTFLESIRHCKERGVRFVDVVGINSPNRGDFKTSFNAIPTAYNVVTWERPSVTT